MKVKTIRFLQDFLPNITPYVCILGLLEAVLVVMVLLPASVLEVTILDFPNITLGSFNPMNAITALANMPITWWLYALPLILGWPLWKFSLYISKIDTSKM